MPFARRQAERKCIVAGLGETQAAVSQQLMRLRAEGFVRAERQGKQMLYGLANTRIIPVIEVLRQGYCLAMDEP